MKQIYSGNIESISSLVDKINCTQKTSFFAINEITYAKLKNNKLVLSGMFCKGIGQLEKRDDFIDIELKVRLRRPFAFFGIFILVLLSGFIWGENVTINGDSDPSMWKRIGFFLIGLAFFSITTLLLRKLRKDFEKKIIQLLN
jgi:hypothetical protein